MGTPVRVFIAGLAGLLAFGAGVVPAAGLADRADPAAAAVARYWTAERRAQAVPRDPVLDERGLWYLRLPDGTLRPYGHATPAAQPAPSADTSGPAITNMDPASGQTIGTSYTFKATVADPSGVRSATFVITYPDGVTTQSFKASSIGNDVWAVSLQGFSSGSWQWHVVAKDRAKPANTSTSPKVAFTVDTGGGGGGGGGTVTNAEWTGGGALQTAVGRIYFELPANKQKTRWTGYVCSGTAVTDTAGAVSIVLTAAHCVYDDVYKEFARNVLFIPDQAHTSGGGTDLNCSNDPLGCWAPSHGVVDSDWATRTWPDNIPWDYAYYVVPSSGAHSGTAAVSESLEQAAATLGISFAAPTVGAFTHALGYSYNQDPKLMYCAESMGTQGSSNWWLSQCGLTGGSSGGPWMQPLDVGTGSGPVVSVNSWGYTGSPGMAGPKLSGTSASCLFDAAQTNTTSTARGHIPSGC